MALTPPAQLPASLGDAGIILIPCILSHFAQIVIDAFLAAYMARGPSRRSDHTTHDPADSHDSELEATAVELEAQEVLQTLVADPADADNNGNQGKGCGDDKHGGKMEHGSSGGGTSSEGQGTGAQHVEVEVGDTGSGTTSSNEGEDDNSAGGGEVGEHAIHNGNPSRQGLLATEPVAH